eukprot:11473829-Alexandrium_andersonii.AAC.1
MARSPFSPSSATGLVAVDLGAYPPQPQPQPQRQPPLWDALLPMGGDSVGILRVDENLSLIHISEPTRLALI